MHFEILVEDRSGKAALDLLIPKILGPAHTFKVLSYRGIGRIPKSLKASGDPSKRILLDQLPRLLQGYGRAFANYPAVVVVVPDLDDRCLKAFRGELFDLLAACRPRPDTRFCIAIEEGEAWLLGDAEAVREAYPRAKKGVLEGYDYDSICGTWELLADAIHPGGATALRRSGWYTVGTAKSDWARAIAEHMDIDRNRSPSFRYFRNTLRRDAGAGSEG